MNVLGIDTSCDDTAAAVVRDGVEIRSSVVASQVSLHARWGGIVPEIASRAHLEALIPVVEEALARAGLALADIDAIGVTTGPGLVGALLVGLAAAKALAFALGKPLVAVDHIEAHVTASRLAAPGLEPPFLSLIVSGGHTELFRYRGRGDFDLLGETQDDAAGEAFDKVAALLGLPYPGGPSIEEAAKSGDPKAHRFPRSLLGGDSLDFSFSGLKTAVLYHLRGQDARRGAFGAAFPPKSGGRHEPPGTRCVRSRVGGGDVMGGENPAALTDRERASVAASFQEAIVDTLVAKVKRAVKKTGLGRVAVGGGVACNARLREKLLAAGAKHRFAVFFPPGSLCTDNAAMVAALAYLNLEAGGGAGLDVDVIDTKARRGRDPRRN